MKKVFEENGFIALVKEMRGAQKDYFSSRAPSLLNRARELEKQVDKYIQGWERRNEPEQARLV